MLLTVNLKFMVQSFPYLSFVKVRELGFGYSAVAVDKVTVANDDRLLCLTDPRYIRRHAQFVQTFGNHIFMEHVMNNITNNKLTFFN